MKRIEGELFLEPECATAAIDAEGELYDSSEKRTRVGTAHGRCTKENKCRVMNPLPLAVM